MGLIGVPELCHEGYPARIGLLQKPVGNCLETCDPRVQLGRHADLLVKLFFEPSRPPAESPGEFCNAHISLPPVDVRRDRADVRLPVRRILQKIAQQVRFHDAYHICRIVYAPKPLLHLRNPDRRAQIFGKMKAVAERRRVVPRKMPDARRLENQEQNIERARIVGSFDRHVRVAAENGAIDGPARPVFSHSVGNDPEGIEALNDELHRLEAASVTVALDMAQVEKTEESFDPARTAVRNEKRSKETSAVITSTRTVDSAVSGA